MTSCRLYYLGNKDKGQEKDLCVFSTDTVFFWNGLDPQGVEATGIEAAGPVRHPTSFRERITAYASEEFMRASSTGGLVGSRHAHSHCRLPFPRAQGQ